MKKKGFTLIELLAVIVILAIIALIAVPIVLNVISKVEKGAAEVSATNYVSAIENYVITSELKGNVVADATYNVGDLAVELKGNPPTSGTYTIEKGIVKTGTFCMNGYNIEYKDNVSTATGKCDSESKKKDAEISLSETSIKMSKGDYYKLSAKSTSGGELTCSSSDENMATCSVSSNTIYVYTGKEKQGTVILTIISAETDEYKEAKTELTIGIGKFDGYISLSSTSGKIPVGSSTSITALINDGTISCISSDESIATCSVSDNTTTINGITAGTATITVTSGETDDYTSASATYSVIVKTPVSLSESVQLGDYISMTPTSTSYTLDANITGVSNNQTIYLSTQNLWRVVRINNDGTIEVVSEEVSCSYVYFQGQTGYQNFVGYLNVIASQYTNEKYVKSTRHMGYNNQTEYITDTSKLVSTTTPWACSTGESCSPVESQGGGDTLYVTDTTLVKNALGTLEARSTCSAFGHYWLSSRQYSFHSDGWGFEVSKVMSDGTIIDITMLSNNFNLSLGESVRPILTLKSGLQTAGSGTSEDPYVLP